MEVLQTDLFHGYEGRPNGSIPHVPLAASLMKDGGFTEHVADTVTFSGYDTGRTHPHVVSHATFPTTCVRWPYGQVHVNAFTKAGRAKWYPPDFDPSDAMMGYCEKFGGRFVHCRRDGMERVAREAFCDANPMASYVFLGVVLRETRSVDDVCSPNRKLCVVVPGYGAASSVASALSKVAEGGTILVTPFGKEHLTYAMETQWYKRIGSTPLMQNERVSSKLLNVWNTSFPSPIGISSAGKAITHLADLKDPVDDSDIADVIDAMTAFWDNMIDPRRSAMRAFTPNQKVCLDSEMSLPARNGGMNSIRCVPRDNVQLAIDESAVVVATEGVILRSAVRSVPILFAGAGAGSSCLRVRVVAARVRLGPVRFDQSLCHAEDTHARTPMVVVGANSTSFVAEHIDTMGASVALSVLGGFDKDVQIINVSGMQASVSGAATWCAAFASAWGDVSLNCSDNRNVLVQSARPDMSVSLRSLLTGAPLDEIQGYHIANISDYTNVFAVGTERRIYHRPSDVSTTAWLFACIMVVGACIVMFANCLLWVKTKVVLATIARGILNRQQFLGAACKPGEVNAAFEIYTVTYKTGRTRTRIHFKQGGLTTKSGSVERSDADADAFEVAAQILFTATDCYDEYPDLTEHVHNSLR